MSYGRHPSTRSTTVGPTASTSWLASVIGLFEATFLTSMTNRRGARCPMYHGEGLSSQADMEAALMAISMIPDQNLQMAAAIAGTCRLHTYPI